MYSINENIGIVQPILILSAPLSTDFTLQVINTDSTATGKHNIKIAIIVFKPQQISLIFVVGDGDYNAGPYSVKFSAGQTEASFDVIINKDDMLERNESFLLRINSSTLPPDMVTLDANNEATVFILNDDSKLCTLVYMD